MLRAISLTLLGASAWFLACSTVSYDPNAGLSANQPEGGAGSSAGGRTPSSGGKPSSGGAGNPVGQDDGGEAGALTSPPMTIMPPCDENGANCQTDCADVSAHCTVAYVGVSCEFLELQGASAQVGCGQRVTVGRSMCGACGPVDVQVYYDGKNCYQGIPGCERSEYKDQFFLSQPQVSAEPGIGGASSTGGAAAGGRAGMGGAAGAAGAPAAGSPPDSEGGASSDGGASGVAGS